MWIPKGIFITIQGPKVSDVERVGEEAERGGRYVGEGRGNERDKQGPDHHLGQTKTHAPISLGIPQVLPTPEPHL